MTIYLVFIHEKGNQMKEFIGTYATRELAEQICELYNTNPHYQKRGEWADFFSDEVSNKIDY